MVHAPELLILYALDMFLVLSILTVLFDSSFPLAVPYFFQLLSIAGTGHMYISQVFKEMFPIESRFWYSFFYLGAMMLSAFAISAYLLLVKKSLAKGLMFSGAFTMPTTSFGLYLMTFYKNFETVPFILKKINGNWLIVIISLSLIVLAKGTSIFLEADPNLSCLKFSIKETLRELLLDQEEIVIPEVYVLEEEQYNPVDFVHVENVPEMEQEDYDF